MKASRRVWVSLGSAGLLAVTAVFLVVPSAAEGRSARGAVTFGPRITNRWSPMPVGASYTFLGVQEGKIGLDRMRVLGPTKLIAGVQCRVELDRVFLNRKPVERTFDYFAQDSKGNVWYYGEDS